jgi:hypothetical protein
MNTTTQTTVVNGIKKEVSKSLISFDDFSIGDNQKEGTKTAQIRQTVKTVSHYPSKKVDSDLQDNLFSTEQFGFSSKPFTQEEIRVAWLLVPPTATKEVMEGLLATANKNGACIYKVLSNKPILDNNQEYAVSSGLRSMDQFANTQAVRYPEGAKDELGNDRSNQLVLDKAGNVQYRRTFYSSTPKEDIDVRNEQETFVSTEIAVEMQGASQIVGQTI